MTEDEQSRSDWIKTEEAAELLSISTRTLYGSTTIREAIKREFIGANHRNGVLWYRPDIEAIIKVRKRFKLRTVPAARLVKEGLRS